MTDFKVGDQVTIMPSGTKGHIIDIDLKSTYPIVVNWLHSPSKYEGSYTLEGFRYLSKSLDSQKHYITKDVVVSTQTTESVTKTSPYWSIVKANSLFIYLTHASHGSRIIPITSVTIIRTNRDSVILDTKSITLDLGPIQFNEVANLLFAKHQSNSI